jgi:hypothetical protein
MARMAKKSDEKGGNGKEKVKFIKKSKDFKKLAKLFKDGKISPCDKPSSIRESDTDFMKYTPTQFRSQFNNLKKVYKTSSKEGMTFSSSKSCFCLCLFYS